MQILFLLILKLVLHLSCFIPFQDLSPFSLSSKGCILLHYVNLPDFTYPMVYSWTSRCLFWYCKLYYCECPYVSTCSYKREFNSKRSSWTWKGVGKRHRHGALWLPLPTPLCCLCQFTLNTAALRAFSLHAAQPPKVLVHTRVHMDGVVLRLQLFLPLREASSSIFNFCYPLRAQGYGVFNFRWIRWIRALLENLFQQLFSAEESCVN